MGTKSYVSPGDELVDFGVSVARSWCTLPNEHTQGATARVTRRRPFHRPWCPKIKVGVAVLKPRPTVSLFTRRKPCEAHSLTKGWIEEIPKHGKNIEKTWLVFQEKMVRDRETIFFSSLRSGFRGYSHRIGTHLFT